MACTGAVRMDAVLATIRTLESGGDYAARAAGSSASGAYQFIDTTWARYHGYPSAWQAPPQVQDAKAAEHVTGILDRHDGDLRAVPVVWYIGYVPVEGSPAWDAIPSPEAGNRLTPRQYQTRWLAEYDRQLASEGSEPTADLRCPSGSPIPALADGYAYPGPADLFARAPVDSPHHDYPAWDWGLPTGTPLYAVRGGRVLTVQYWPHNWWDRNCTIASSGGCSPCGIGVTIEDETGTRWTYCHGFAIHVDVGESVAAGTQILTSGNTGRSSGPHLHLQIRSSDGHLRCPQPLLRSLRDHGMGIDQATLPRTGCSY